MITVFWIDHNGENCRSRFTREIDAIRFEESLDAEGLQHHRN